MDGCSWRYGLLVNKVGYGLSTRIGFPAIHSKNAILEVFGGALLYVDKHVVMLYNSQN